MRNHVLKVSVRKVSVRADIIAITPGHTTFAVGADGKLRIQTVSDNDVAYWIIATFDIIVLIAGFIQICHNIKRRKRK